MPASVVNQAAKGFQLAGPKLLKEVRRMLDKRVQSPDASKRVKEHLKQRIEQLTQGGEPPLFDMFVDGKADNGDLSTITFRGSVITVKFHLLDGVVRAILDYAKTISPRESGAYADAWFVMVNNVIVTDLSKKIPHNSTVVISNFAPYARRLEEQGRLGRSGRLTTYPHPELVVTERTRAWASSQFKGALIERLFITIPGGGSARGWEVPYHLKRPPHQGEEITYPALRLTER
jgi:hypothetical protein